MKTVWTVLILALACLSGAVAQEGPTQVGESIEWEASSPAFAAKGSDTLVWNELLTFPGGKEGREVVVESIPEDLVEKAALWREELLSE